MVLNVITLFPEFFKSPLEVSIIKRAIEKGLVRVNIFNLRDYSELKLEKCDDYPYGGGPGMVLAPGPIFNAITSIRRKFKKSKTIFFTPSGKRLNNELIRGFSRVNSFILLCGHYEGIDQRVIDLLADFEVSIGDYIVTGGEVAALVFIEAVSRLKRGVLSNVDSTTGESFERGLLKYSQYTRPENFRGLTVPKVLLSGNHKKVKKWRSKVSLLKTIIRRPDMFKKAKLTIDEEDILSEIMEEKNSGR